MGIVFRTLTSKEEEKVKVVVTSLVAMKNGPYKVLVVSSFELEIFWQLE